MAFDHARAAVGLLHGGVIGLGPLARRRILELPSVEVHGVGLRPRAREKLVVVSDRVRSKVEPVAVGRALVRDAPPIHRVRRSVLRAAVRVDPALLGLGVPMVPPRPPALVVVVVVWWW